MSKRKHNTGSYQFRDGRHIIQFSENGKRRTRTLKSKEEADKLLLEISNGAYKNLNDRSGLNISQLFDKWIDSKEYSPYNYGCKVRFNKHLKPLVGHLAPNKLDMSTLKGIIPILRKNGLSKASIGLVFRILSSFLSELLEEGLVNVNVVTLLSKKTKKELFSEKDPAKIPFLKNIEDVGKLYTWLNAKSRSVSVAYAIGVLSGLRVNEIRALAWSDINFDDRLINVQWQASSARDGEERLRPTKNGKSRLVPMSDTLFNILSREFERVQGIGWVCRPYFTQDKSKRFLGKNIISDLVKQGLKVLKLPKMTLYAASRHTFATQYIINGGSMIKLKEILGHSSIVTTEKHYLHLQPGQYSENDRNIIKVEMKDHDRAQSDAWMLKEIDSKLRGSLLPTDKFL